MRSANRLWSVFVSAGAFLTATMIIVTPVTAGAAAAVNGPSTQTSGTSGPRVVSVGTPKGIKRIHQSTDTSPSGKALELYLHSTATEGVIAVTPKVYLVFWGSQWSTDPAKAEPALQAFFKAAYGSADHWGTVLDQYCQGLAVNTVNCGSLGTHIQHPTSKPLAGVWFDNGAAEPTNATAAQIAAEAAAAATHFGNTTQNSNLDTQYVIASPTGTHPDKFPNNGFCAWHASANTTDGTIAYTNLPYVPDLGNGPCTTLNPSRLLDGYFSTETHEYAETVTDMWPNNGWLDSKGAEIGDKCQNVDALEKLSTGTFDVQGIWSNKLKGCVTTTSPTWTAQATQPQAGTNQSPALAYFNGKLYAAWTGTSGNAVFYSAFNGKTWSSQATISGGWGQALTNEPPALIAANGALYAAWAGQTLGDIFYSAFNGTTWSAQATVSGTWGTATTDRSPALAVNGTLLWVAWKGNGNTNVYFSAPSGGAWQSPTAVPGASTSDAPALVGTPNAVYSAFDFAWTTSTEKIDTEALGGLGWAPIETLPQILTDDGPTVALMDQVHLVFAVKGKGSSTKIFYDYTLNFQGARDSWSSQAIQPQAGTNLRPALASNGTTLTTAWTGATSTAVFYASTTNPYSD
jgi:hypothetical protein